MTKLVRGRVIEGSVIYVLSKSFKKERTEKEKEKKKIITLVLKPEHSLRGIWQNSLNLGALNQLVGSHRLCCSLNGWISGV